MWYTIVLTFTIVLSASVVTSVPHYARCPKQCDCNNDVIVCKNLEIDKFGTKVYYLKVTNPNKPLLLKENVFSNMGVVDVHRLYIENARIEEFHENAFGGLDSLLSLSLINCDIPNFNPESIRFPASLEKLSFSGTQLNKFHLNLGSLDEVNLSHCGLSNIPSDMFADVSQLTYIDLSNNKIDSIDVSAFTNLQYITEIKLSNNRLKTIPNELFSQNQDLVSLDLSSNPLSTINVKFTNKLESLILRNCSLLEFERVNLEVLSYLDLSYNQLENVTSATFAGMADLEYIDLSFNGIAVLPEDVFINNINLQKIILDENKMDKLPTFIGKDVFATSLFSCNNCDIDNLSNDTFKMMPAIVILRLAGNNFETIGTTFQNLHALTSLDVSGNSIIAIDSSAFNRNSALRIINISDNSLTALHPNLFENNKVLQELDISENGLSTIWSHPTEKTLESLLIINVAYNQMNRLLINDLKITPNLQVLNITDNNIECDANFKEAIEWLEERQVLPGKESRNLEMVYGNSIETSNSRKTWICHNPSMQYHDYESYSDYEYSKTTDKFPDDTYIIAEEEEDDEINIIPAVQEAKVKDYANLYFWPVLVFFITAALVLLVVANVILYILRKRGNIAQARPITMPRVKLLPILTASKLKKHSGTVYKPLSEENLDTRSNISINTDVPHTNLL